MKHADRNTVTMATQSILVTVRIAAYLLIAGLTLPSAAFQTSNQSKKLAAGDRSATQPYSFEHLLRLLDNAKNPSTFVTLPTIIKTLGRNGVAFQPTQEQLEALRKKGATEELIKAIKEKAGIQEAPPAAEVSPEPPRPKEGHLTVACKPVDCVVHVDKKPIGSTKKGELSVTLLEGQVTVSASSDNYIPDKEGQVVEITADGSVSVVFVFKLSPAALQAKGIQLFGGMIEALGGEAGLQESRFVKAVGTLTLHSAGAQKLWPVTAFIQLPDKARFDITKANENYIIIYTESGYDLGRSKSKNLKGQELEDLEDALRRFQDNQISKIVNRLRGSGVRMTADKLAPAPGEDAVMRVEQGADTYIVTLAADSRPKEIRLESAGLNSGLRILLSEYNKLGSAVIPYKTQVILPGTPTRGVVVHFDTVIVDPPGVDFGIKKGGRLSGR